MRLIVAGSCNSSR